jgi:hypothetical protein
MDTTVMSRRVHSGHSQRLQLLVVKIGATTVAWTCFVSKFVGAVRDIDVNGDKNRRAHTSNSSH